MRRAVPFLLLVLLAGCSKSGRDGEGPVPTVQVQIQTETTATTAPSAAPAAAPEKQAQAKPKTPPKPPAREVRVIRRWAAALRKGKVDRAADYFANRARVQNGSPLILTLRDRGARVAFNATLPCGARPTKYARAKGGFIVVTFRLVERAGGDCRGAAGDLARCAIRVRHDRIVAWYRLPDPGTQGSGGTQTTPVTPPAGGSAQDDNVI